MTLTKPYEATFQVGDGETKDFPFYFDEVSENFIRVIIKRADGSIYYPTFSVDMELLRVVFGEDEITPTADDVICIYRDTPAVQDTQFNTLQGYNAKALENILSKIVAMIQEMKANGFSTQILQGEPWSLDLIKPADDGASVQIDYRARVLKKGLYFKITSGNLQVSADGSNYITMPKSTDVAEFRQQQTEMPDHTYQYRLQYRVGNTWYNAESNAEATADAALQVAEEARDIASDAKNTVDSHVLDYNNPHQVTASQVGLGNVDNTADLNKPVSTAQQNAINTAKQDVISGYTTADGELQSQITTQATAIAGKQDQLTAGDNVVIDSNGVISATVPDVGGFDMVVVDQLPETGEKGILYLVKKDGAAPDVHDEYVWIESTQTFELIGTTQVDLTDYVKNTDYATATKGGVVKTTGEHGLWTSAGILKIQKATNEQIINKTHEFRPIVPNNLDYAVAKSITTNTIELTNDEKTAARTWIGASRVIIRKWS